MKFTFRCGDRPLDGYVIKRGIGRGGFGEVYFAVSDHGKEVALKWLRSHDEIEMRGVSHCLNLKHPGLVHLYDLRTDGGGHTWLIMEHVQGDSLHAHLERHPNGLPRDLACTWFLGLCQAVCCLHDHGIVHRDLKPGNIFIENGQVKVGDYGLCKFMGGSQQVGQTQSVGTVHYMAPEISTGNYNRNVDIYAAGVILYQMLTGRVPFDGETAGEVLMKHLTQAPDLTQVPDEFVPILDKALCKNPALRYRNIEDMARQVAPLLKDGPAPASASPQSTSAPRGTISSPESPAGPVGGSLAESAGSLLVAAAAAATISALYGMAVLGEDWRQVQTPFLLAVAASWSILIAGWWWRQPLEESGPRRAFLALLGLSLGLLALWLDGFQLPVLGGPQADSLRPLVAPSGEGKRHGFYDALYPANQRLPVLIGYLAYFGLIFLSVRWWKILDPRRRQRFDLQPVLIVGFWAYLLLFLLPAAAQRQEAFVALVQTAAIVQLASRWEPDQRVRHKRLRLKVA